jgi:hypothetical protein
VGNVDAVVAGALNQIELREIESEIEAANAQIPSLEGEALADLVKRIAALKERKRALGPRRYKVGTMPPTRSPKEDA